MELHHSGTAMPRYRTMLSPSNLLLACLVLLTTYAQGTNVFSSIERVGNITTAELIKSAGYAAERHTIKSGDGFLITVFRIPNKSGPAVLFAHGILLASDSWVLRGAKQDLAFLLADKGYDIWLADTRGNCYSHKHSTLDERDPKFWDFSFDEMGFYDVPAIIDYILERKHGQSKLFYIGHSLGTTMFFATCSTRPEYNDKVHLMIGLAPAAYFSKLLFLPDNASLMTARYLSMVLKIANENLATHELLPRSRVTVGTARTMCGPNSMTLPLCHFFIASFFGISHPGDLGSVERRYVANITSFLPSGTSIKTMNHLMELAISKKYQHFDYGAQGNRQRYNTSKVPQYNLSLVTVPTALFYARGDMLVPYKNVDRLAAELGNLVSLNRLPKATFNHMDFVWGKDARKLVFGKIFELFSNLENKERNRL